MGAWNTYSFSNDSVYDFLQLDVIPFRIIGGVDELEITQDILKEILADIDNCTDNYTKMAATIFLVYKGCQIELRYIDDAIIQAENEYVQIKDNNSNSWSDQQKRLDRLQEEIDNLKKAKIYGKINPLHIPSISDSASEKISNN